MVTYEIDTPNHPELLKPTLPEAPVGTFICSEFGRALETGDGSAMTSMVALPTAAHAFRAALVPTPC